MESNCYSQMNAHVDEKGDEHKAQGSFSRRNFLRFLGFATTLFGVGQFAYATPKKLVKKRIVFPDKDWDKRLPKKLGINEEALKGIAQILEREQSNGVLIRNGYLVAEWNYGGPEDKMFEVLSVTKSIIGILVGTALKSARISSLQARVIDY